eukprot:COSAG01_NODE_8229_length_2865_cov_2.201374_4_plen_74_part_00
MNQRCIFVRTDARDWAIEEMTTQIRTGGVPLHIRASAHYIAKTQPRCRKVRGVRRGVAGAGKRYMRGARKRCG